MLGLANLPSNKAVSYPLNFMPPTLKEINDTTDLENILLEEDCFRSDGEIHQLQEYINRFGKLIRIWSQNLAAQKGLPTELSENLYRLLTSGSLKLKAILLDEDVEIFVGFSSHVTDTDLENLFQFLQGQNHLLVNLVVVNGKVGFKIRMEGFDLNIIMYYSRLYLEEFPDNLNIRQLEWWRHVNKEDSSIKSLSETKATFEILDLVPNRESFQATLKAIKLWSRRKAIFDSNLGFLSNLAHAVLVAKICQMYPTAAPSALVQAFFEFYSSWDWDEAIVLKEFEQPAGLDLNRWHPCDSCFMPIILPGYPEQNATQHTTISGKSVIIRELQYAKKITEKVLKGDLRWSRLFDKASFFSRYKRFVILSYYSKDTNSLFSLQQMMAIEIYRFIQELDNIPQISLAHISPRCEMFSNGTLLGFGPGYFICRFIGIELKDTNVGKKELYDKVLECSRVYMNYIYGRLSDYNLFTQEMDSRVDIINDQDIFSYLSSDLTIEDKRIRDVELSIIFEEPGVDKPTTDS